MLNYFRNIEYLKSNKVIGLHCTLNGSDKPKFYYILLLKKKGKIEIGNCMEVQCDIEKLSENITMKYPIYLSIEGKGILHKQVTQDSSKTILQQAIPNANESDFIVEGFNGCGQTKFISFARRDNIDSILKKLSDQKFQVIGLTISPFTMVGIFEIFPDLPSSLLTGLYEIEVSKTDQKIASFRKIDSENSDYLQYAIGENSISSSSILPFYNAFTYYTNQSRGFEYPIVTSQKAEYISKRLFVATNWGILIFIFLGLLVNLLVFSDLSEQKLQLETQVSGNRDLVIKLKNLKEELSWKEKFVGQAGLDRKMWFSYIADQIAASVPEEISLEKLDLHPLSSKIRNQKEIELQSDIILINGVTKSSVSVNQWALTLKKITGISNVVVENFSQLENSSSGTFSIKISLSNYR